MKFGVRLDKFNFYSFDMERESHGKLLPPQVEALQSLENFFHRNPLGHTAIISMPTGSGKSGVISCLPYFLGKTGLTRPTKIGVSPEGSPLHPFDKPVLVIAPDLAIAKQLEGSLLRVQEGEQEDNFLLRRGIVPEKNARDVLPVGKKIEETLEVKQPNILKGNEILIANAQKFLGIDWERTLPKDLFRLVIVDEAHHHPATTWRRIVNHFQYHAMVVFFTATPFRGDRVRVIEEGEGSIIYHLPLNEARRKRIIRVTNFVEIEDDNRDANIYREVLRRVQAEQERKDAEQPLPDGIPHMAIAIAKNIDEAKLVVQIALDIWNCPAELITTYHSDNPNHIRRATMTAIRENKIRLVVVVSMLLEGFDHPPISIAAIMTKISSPVKFVQFIGRAQRIVRGKDGQPESEGIEAHIFTHREYEQAKNYEAFQLEELIPHHD